MPSFSDRTVWPCILVEEAWKDGLDSTKETLYSQGRSKAKILISRSNYFNIMLQYLPFINLISTYKSSAIIVQEYISDCKHENIQSIIGYFF